MDDEDRRPRLDELLLSLAADQSDVDEDLASDHADEDEPDGEEPELDLTPGAESELPSGDDLFFRRMGRTALLTKIDEQRLAKEIELLDKPRATAAERERGERALHEMVEANLRLVVSIARRYQSPSMSLSDLVQEGSIGLMTAARRFDWRKGFKFSTYATWWIQQSCQRAVGNQGRTIRIPIHLIGTLGAAQRLRREAAASGKPLSLEQLAAELDTTAEDLLLLESRATPTVSLSTPLGEGEDELGDLFADDSVSVERDVERRSLVRVVNEAMENLTVPERLVLMHRFGLDDHPARSLEGTGKMLEMTRIAVRRLERSALKKLEAAGVLADLFRAAGR